MGGTRDERVCRRISRIARVFGRQEQKTSGHYKLRTQRRSHVAEAEQAQTECGTTA